MKKLLAITCLFFLLGCKKGNVDGIVIITVMFDGNVVPNPTIYMKKGATKDPKIPLTSYDLKVDGNSSGQAVIEKLASDSYYFHSVSKIDTLQVVGGAVATVSPKEAPNRYEIKINVF